MGHRRSILVVEFWNCGADEDGGVHWRLGGDSQARLGLGNIIPDEKRIPLISVDISRFETGWPVCLFLRVRARARMEAWRPGLLLCVGCSGAQGPTGRVRGVARRPRPHRICRRFPWGARPLARASQRRAPSCPAVAIAKRRLQDVSWMNRRMASCTATQAGALGRHLPGF